MIAKPESWPVCQITLRRYPCLFLLLCLIGFSHLSKAQKKESAAVQKCGTMPRLEQMLQRNPQLKQSFSGQEAELTFMASQAGKTQMRVLRSDARITIPVVFHIVLPNPAIVTDAQIQAQLDTLNKSFFGTNGDSVRIPAHFKPFFGKSTIQFCLAQRTPEGDETTGIVRKSSTVSSFGVDDGVKHASTGGVDSWNTDFYLNIWVCSLSGGVLGYATFPNDGAPKEQGVVIDHRSLPGGSLSNYNRGKTLVHEAGHYFHLYHIWGDDNGLCTGTDHVDDTPNQGNSTSNCFTGIRTDNCTTDGNGIMYQNYMDYSYDACLVMFTHGQVSRMENALSLYRSSLLHSNGCQPVIRKAHDVQVRALSSPSQRLCSPAFTPVVTIRNNGSQPLNSVNLHTQINGGPVTTTAWNGNLVTAATATISLSNLTTTTGAHQLTVYTSIPNATGDEEKSNDTIRVSFQYYEPVTSVLEGFERGGFPPTAWDIVNPDGGITWQRVSGTAKSGSGSVMINNADYAAIGQKDDLRLPQVSIPSTVDSAFFTFQVAAATYTSTRTENNNWDTLEVMVSVDCGQTYTSLYKKWGAGLITHASPVSTGFVPAAGDWRKDSINLAAFIGQSNLMLTFRNTTGYENNIYLDDIHLRTVTINPNLKKSGFLVTPNPTSGQIAVQFYPQPSGLKGLQVFNASGQKVAEVAISSEKANNLYTFDLSRYPAGLFIVRAVFADRVVTQKIMKL